MKSTLIVIASLTLFTINNSYSKEKIVFTASLKGEKAVTVHQRSLLKGPKAKNYHPAKYTSQASKTQAIKSYHPTRNLQGPKAKNNAPGDYKYNAESLIEVVNAERTYLTGPWNNK